MDEGRQGSEGLSGEGRKEKPTSQQQTQQGQQQYQGPQQPLRRGSAFSANNLNKTLGMILVIGVILLFIGGILVSTAGFLDADDTDNRNTKQNLHAVATLLSSIGLVAIGGAASWAYYQSDRLTEKQELFLMLLVIGTMIGFAILHTSIGPFL